MALQIKMDDKFLAFVRGEGGGGGSGGLVVNCGVDDTLDKTWNEINTAMKAGQPCFILMKTIVGDDEVGTSIEPISLVYYDASVPGSETYTVTCGEITYSADTANDYPVNAGGGME